MQIILASAKIMNVSIKREQSKLVCSVEREKRGMKSNDKVKSSPDISLSLPRFQKEAEGFARDMAHGSPPPIGGAGFRQGEETIDILRAIDRPTSG